MKCNFYNLSFFFMMFSGLLLHAQERTISGTVIDDSGPLPGVSIIIKGTGTGTETDFDGNYSINANTDEILVFSFIGMTTQEKTVGLKNAINIVLIANNVLEEVVLTALGLEKKKDDDISSATSINTDLLKRSGESGLIQGLAGKTSGLKITRNTGDPGAGAFIQIRGANTILGSASPLIVIDGVPISNASTGGGTGGVAQQSRLNDLNQDDIEKVTILKGAASAAVYGTGAANGVIVIQTKRGRGSDGKVSVNFKSLVAFDQVNVEHKKQNKYGQGFPYSFFLNNPTVDDATNYLWIPNTGFSWGDKISDRTGSIDDVTVGDERFESTSGNIYYPIDNKNSTDIFNKTNRDQVFRTGFTFENAISISFSGNKSNTFLSYSDWDQTGIVRGKSEYRRQTFRISNEFDISKKIKVRVSSNYTKIGAERIQQGSNLNGLYLGYLRTSPDFDNRDFKGTYFDNAGLAHANAHRSYRRYLGDRAPIYNNPGWTINEQKNPNSVNRFLINPELNWKIKDNMTLTARYGLDYFDDNRETYFPVNSAGGASTGFFTDRTITTKIEDYNVFISSNHEINDSFIVDWVLGTNFNHRYVKSETAGEANFTNPFVGDLLLFGNATADNNGVGRNITERKKSGVYGVLNINLFDQLLLEFSGRYERPSTLKEAIFYPSASIGWQFSKLFKDSDFLSFGKLRASYGEVGIEPTPYSNTTVFFGGGVGSGWGDGLFGSLYGNPFTRGAIQGNPNLKEERVKEFEVGADFRFFNNRVSLSTTYYNRTTEDAILRLTLPASTGFASRLDNAAKISNKGIEVDLSIKLISEGDFNWNINTSFSKNENLVEDLSGVQSVFLNGFGGTSSRVVEGHAIGALWGGRYLRNDDESYNLDANGFPQASPVNGVIGDPNPDWIGGLGTSLSWKGLTLSALLETSQGAEMWAGTKGVLNYFGIAPNTANESVAPAGGLTSALGIFYPEGTKFRGNIQDFGAGPVALDVDWYTGTGGGFGPLSEQFVDDASWTRLRELSLTYSLPTKLIEKAGFASAEIGVTGRNLILWTDFEGVDPDLNLTGATLGRGLDYFTNPGSKSYIVTMKIGF